MFYIGVNRFSIVVCRSSMGFDRFSIGVAVFL